MLLPKTNSLMGVKEIIITALLCSYDLYSHIYKQSWSRLKDSITQKQKEERILETAERMREERILFMIKRSTDMKTSIS